MVLPQADQAAIYMTFTLKELQVQLQPEWHHAQMFNGEGYGLCIVPYQRLDSAEMGLVPGAITTPGSKRYMSFSWWLLD
jgi:hypothetical protein